MEFIPALPINANQAERKVWEWAKEAFKGEDGIAYYRYPIFTDRGNTRCQPDVMIVHRDYGLWVLECKGFSVDTIQAVDGQQWELDIPDRPTDEPLAQAEDQMYTVKSLLDRNRDSRDKIECRFRVVLPEVKRADWVRRGFPDHPNIGSAVWVYEDLTPAALRHSIEEGSGGARRLSNEDWLNVKAIIGGVPGSPRENPGATRSSPGHATPFH